MTIRRTEIVYIKRNEGGIVPSMFQKVHVCESGTTTMYLLEAPHGGLTHITTKDYQQLGNNLVDYLKSIEN